MKLLTGLLVVALASAQAGTFADREARIAKIQQALRERPGDPKLLLKLGSQYVHLADETAKSESFDEARRHLAEAERAGAGLEVRAWRGLLRCIEAKYGSGPSARAMAQEGLAELDRTVDEDPYDLALRLMRASVSLRVPREWRRLPQAREDLLTIDLALRRDPARLKKHDLDGAEVYFRLGQAQHASGEHTEARAAWQKAAAAAPGTRYANEAAKMLKRHWAAAR